MKGKRIFVIVSVVLICILFSACGELDYTGYKEFQILDGTTPSIILPEDWEVVTIDGWNYIKLADASENDYLAVQYIRASGYVNIDDEYNPYFEQNGFVFEKSDSYYMHSYILKWSLQTFYVLDEQKEFYGMTIHCLSGASYAYTAFTFLDGSLLNKELMKKITNLYGDLRFNTGGLTQGD